MTSTTDSIKDKLKQLKYFSSEISLLKRQIDELQPTYVSDTVIGSDDGFPYNERPIGISGINIDGYERKRRRLQKCYEIRLEQLMDLKTELEVFIAGIDDSLTRQVISLRSINGLPWTQVAESIGGGNTENSVRMVYNRFFNKL